MGSKILANLTQLLKAFWPILVNLLEKVTSVNLEHPWKVEGKISVISLGITTLLAILLHSWKAHDPMYFTELGIVRPVIWLQPSKA